MPIDQESRLSFNTASKWANRFVVTKLPHGTRIAFAEAAPEESKAFHFHSAIIMTAEDAKQLADLLARIAG